MHARTENIRARPSEFTMRGLTKVFTKASDLSLSGGKYASASAVILLCVTPISVLLKRTGWRGLVVPTVPSQTVVEEQRRLLQKRLRACGWRSQKRKHHNPRHRRVR